MAKTNREGISAGDWEFVSGFGGGTADRALEGVGGAVAPSF